ncbi:MAG TPA: hypothetical protein VFV07_01195 [Rhizomicrobium sp.]|nr:hypothetical protein [Rhizomicrobium sp.]
MNIKTASMIVALVGLTGCSGMLADNATKQAQAQCAAEGKQFVPTNVEKHDNPIYSSAAVSGHCAGPGDPGYVAPPSSPKS